MTSCENYLFFTRFFTRFLIYFHKICIYQLNKNFQVSNINVKYDCILIITKREFAAQKNSRRTKYKMNILKLTEKNWREFFLICMI